DSLPVRQFLLEVRQSLLDAYSRQSYPFTLLLKDPTLSTFSDRSPLFDLALQFDQIHSSFPEIENDITIQFSKEIDRLSGTILYQSSLYEAESIQRLAVHFKQVLQSIASDTSLLLREIPMLSESESEQVLRKWNETTESCRFSFVHEWVRNQVGLRPDAIAVEDEQRQESYQQLERRSNQWASHLLRRGVRPELLV